jgi:hypothetical protein
MKKTREKVHLSAHEKWSKERKFLFPRHSDQGDQIGRIFALWAIYYIGWFSENYNMYCPEILGYFFRGRR